MSEKSTATAAPEKTSLRSRGAKQNDGSSSRLALDNPFFGLQQTIGNQAMLRLLDGGMIQTKLRVSQPGDADEQEADRIAEKVVSRKAAVIQRKCACSGGTPCAKCAEEDEEKIHRSAVSPVLRSPQRADQGAAGSPAAEAGAVRSQLGAGRFLDPRAKSEMSAAFDYDFSRVRVHTDSRAAALSSDLQARAFTIGSDIAFASGEYQPGTPVGDALIAHELAHVVQQNGGSETSALMQKGADEAGYLEEEADRKAIGALVALRTGMRGALSEIGSNATSQLRSGLRLQRCGAAAPRVKPPAAAPLTTKAPEQTAPPTVAPPQPHQPTTAEQIPRAYSRGFVRNKLSTGNVDRAVRLFGATPIANNLVTWLTQHRIPVTAAFIASSDEMPGKDKTADGTYEQVGTRSYKVYVLSGAVSPKYEVIDDRGTKALRETVVDAAPESMADTLFHELLHVWFVNAASDAAYGYETGHTAQVKPTEIFGEFKTYDEPNYDPRFLAKLKQFDAQIREVKQKEREQTQTPAPTLQRKASSGGTLGDENTHRDRVGPALRSPELSIQRSPADGSATSTEGAKTPHRPRAVHPFVVEDNAEKVEPHQMRKSQFIALLRTDACATADAVLMSVGRNTKGCPYIEKWLSFYEKQSSQHLESAMQKYAPETRNARSAHEAIRLLLVRIQKAATTWAKTGKVEGLPPEIASLISGGGGFLEKVHNFATTGVAGAIFGFIGGKGKTEDTDSSGVMRKAKTAESTPTHDAASVRSQLGTGNSLDSRVQSQMSSAFGYDFSGVRVHTDSNASELSSNLQARAFTIGNDVAFASNEYRPGTLIGDALIAHELAHVVQQSGGTASSGPMMKGTGDYDSLERDADGSAVAAVMKLWGGTSASLGRVGRTVMPSIKSGLRLSRCDWFKSKSEDAGVKDAGVKDVTPEDAGQPDAGTPEAPGGNMANKKLSDADKSKITDTFKPSSTSGQVGASMKDTRFVLHDTGVRPTGKGKTPAEKAADLEKKEQASIAEHRKSGGTPVGEGPSSYVTGAGTPEIAHPHFFEADRPTATEFERGNDLMDKRSREAGMQKVWALTDPKEQAAAISTYLARFSTLSAKEITSETNKAIKNLDASQSAPNNDPSKPVVLTTAQGAVGVICTKIATAGSGAGVAVKGKEKDLETACGGLSALFATRKQRIASSTNVEISAEKGSDCSTDPKKAKPFDPYPAADYSAVAKLYLLAALEIGQFPEITSHFFLDKPPITTAMNRCDPRCWDLGRLYATIASILGHPSGTTYGVDFIPGTTWGTSTIWWFDPVCGAKPGAKASAPGGGSGTPPPVKKPE